MILDVIADFLEDSEVIKQGAKLHSLRHGKAGPEVMFVDTKHPSGKPYYLCIVYERQGLNTLAADALDLMIKSRRDDPEGLK